MSVECSPANRIRGISVTRTIPGQGDLGFSAYSQPSPPPPKTTMFSRLSTSKAALKSVGTAARTPSFPSPTVRAKTTLGLPSNPHPSVSIGPPPLLQRWSSHSSGPYFLFSSRCQPLNSSHLALTHLPCCLGLRQHTHCWFDCLVYPPLRVASICWPSSCQLPRRGWSASHRLSMVTQRMV